MLVQFKLGISHALIASTQKAEAGACLWAQEYPGHTKKSKQISLKPIFEFSLPNTISYIISQKKKENESHKKLIFILYIYTYIYL